MMRSKAIKGQKVIWLVLLIVKSGETHGSRTTLFIQKGNTNDPTCLSLIEGPMKTYG